MQIVKLTKFHMIYMYVDIPNSYAQTPMVLYAPQQWAFYCLYQQSTNYSILWTIVWYTCS